ncbi:MAG: glycosyltransferase [Bacteroidetes bacterium]|nr:glycosyltransferase [Bacteroidota bacterium]
MNTKNLPLVSIITPVFNSSKFLNDSIQSVLNQSYSNWEHLLVDDCSTDNSVELIEIIQKKDHRIKLFRLKVNSGSGLARNLAIESAKGKYVAFLDSDDYWAPHKLETQVKFMENNKIAFSHSSYGFWSEDGVEIRKPYNVSESPVSYKDLLKKTEISCLTAIYNQEIIGKMFMPNLRRKQDYALWLSILKKGYKSYPQQEVLAYYRQRKGSATNKKQELILKHYKFLRNNEKLSVPKSILYTIYWIWNGLVKFYF